MVVMAVLVAMVAVASGTWAVAETTVGDTQVISGCFAQRTGALRVLVPGDSCTSKETAISWNEQGPAGQDGVVGSLDDLEGVPCNEGTTADGVVDVRYGDPEVDGRPASLMCMDTDLATLQVTTAGEGTVSGGGIDCGETCARSYEAETGESVTLTAAASSGWAFTGWSGACSGLGSCTVTMDQDREVHAQFTRVRILAVTVNNSESQFLQTTTGQVAASPLPRSGVSPCVAIASNGFPSSNFCQFGYLDGETVTLTASGTVGFNGWSGVCSGSALTCTVTMNADKSVSAFF